MSLASILGIGDAIKGILDKFIPDADVKLKAQLELATKEIVQEHERLMGQISVNVEEAKHPNIFVSGWRPAVGWICAISLGYTFMGYPLLTWLTQLAKVQPPPNLNSDLLTYLISAMLGVGAMRTIDKYNEVDTRGVSLRKK